MEKNKLAETYLENINKENLISQSEILSMESLLGSNFITNEKKITHFTKNRSSINVDFVKASLESFIQEFNKENQIDFADRETKLEKLRTYIEAIKSVLTKNKDKVKPFKFFSNIITGYPCSKYPMGDSFISIKECPMIHYFKGYNTTGKSNLAMTLENIYSEIRNMTSQEGVPDYVMNFNKEEKIEELKQVHSKLPKLLDMVEEKVKFNGRFNSISLISLALFNYLKTIQYPDDHEANFKMQFELAFTSEAIANCSLYIMDLIHNEEIVIKALNHYLLLTNESNFEIPDLVNNLYHGSGINVLSNSLYDLQYDVELDAMGIYRNLIHFSNN